MRCPALACGAENCRHTGFPSHAERPSHKLSSPGNVPLGTRRAYCHATPAASGCRYSAQPPAFHPHPTSPSPRDLNAFVADYRERAELLRQTPSKDASVSLTSKRYRSAEEQEEAGVAQRSAHWHKARANRLTASSAAAAVGLLPRFRSDRSQRQQHWERLVGLSRPFTGNSATRWGSGHERSALEAVTKLFAGALEVHHCSFDVLSALDDRARPLTWIGASPDGILRPPDASSDCESFSESGQGTSTLSSGSEVEGSEADDALANEFAGRLMVTPGSVDGTASTPTNASPSASTVLNSHSLEPGGSEGHVLLPHLARHFVDSVGVLEIKCPYSIRDQRPWQTWADYYLPQIHTQMRVLGASYAYMVCWTMEGISVFYTEADERYWEELLEAMEEFWGRHVLPAKVLMTDEELSDEERHAMAWHFAPAAAPHNFQALKRAHDRVQAAVQRVC